DRGRRRDRPGPDEGRESRQGGEATRPHRHRDAAEVTARSRPTSSKEDGVRLEGKVAVISGGARGMGAVEARLFAREGAKVVLGDVLEAEGKDVEAEIRHAGGEALFVRLDVTSEADWQRAVETATGRFGKLDVLV